MIKFYIFLLIICYIQKKICMIFFINYWYVSDIVDNIKYYIDIGLVVIYIEGVN